MPSTPETRAHSGIVPRAGNGPGIINISISAIKETTIILMAGMFDCLGVLQSALLDPERIIGDQARVAAYLFAGARIEGRLEVGQRR